MTPRTLAHTDCLAAAVAERSFAVPTQDTFDRPCCTVTYHAADATVPRWWRAATAHWRVTPKE